MSAASSDPLELLHKYWGYPAFREGQRTVIDTILEGRDVLAVLPTGGGKSICYQLPALLTGGLTLVISPLISLMQDQVSQLTDRRIPAAFINSTLTAREVDQRWLDAEHGRYRLLYVAPEQLASEKFLARSSRLPLRLLAVDEAHCVSEWGPHFRPSYLTIAETRRKLGNPPLIAVTATATPEVRHDVVERLGMRDPLELVQGFDRPNIVWSIFQTENKRTKVIDVLRGVEGTGLLYASTRNRVEQWARWLQEEGESVAAYHAGMAIGERKKTQAEWLSGKTRLVVATNAFGMGIDKAAVRFVIHVDLPGSLEAYYQEAGRAGRDGKRSYAVLLFQPSDEETQRILVDTAHPTTAQLRSVYDAVCNLAQIPVRGHPQKLVVPLLERVASLTGLSLPVVKNGIELLERQGVWHQHPVRSNQGLIHFLQPANVVRAYAHQRSNEALSHFVEQVLRTVHADAFGGWWEINLRLLQERTKLSRQRLLRGLNFLMDQQLVEWRGPEDGIRLELLQARSQRLVIDDSAIRKAKRRADTRIQSMRRYARSVSCRRQFLLGYFGEKHAGSCGQCDICLGRHAPVVMTTADEPTMREILENIDAGLPQAHWFFESATSPSRVEVLKSWLIQEGYVAATGLSTDSFTLTEKAHVLMEQWEPRMK